MRGKKMISEKGAFLSAFFSLKKWQEEEKKQQQFLRKSPYKLTHLYIFDGGGCDGCMMALNTLKLGIYGLKEKGFHFVETPKEAQWLLVIGQITGYRLGQLQQDWEAMGRGRALLAVGNCAINGGVFEETYAALNGVEKMSKSFYRLAGCPPSPRELCHGFSALEAEISARLASA